MLKSLLVRLCRVADEVVGCIKYFFFKDININICSSRTIDG